MLSAPLRGCELKRHHQPIWANFIAVSAPLRGCELKRSFCYIKSLRVQSAPLRGCELKRIRYWLYTAHWSAPLRGCELKH